MPTNDLNDLVLEAVAASMTKERVAAAVEQHVDELIKSALRDALSYYSETGKAIKAAVENSLKVRDLDLPEYGFMVTQMAQALIEKHAADMIKGALSADMESLLKLAPKTVKLSEITEAMFKDDDELEEITLILKEPSDFKSRWLYLSPEVCDQSRCEIQVLLSEDGTISAGWLAGKDLKTKKSFGNFYGLEQKFRSYYACGTVIVLDEDNVARERQYD